MNKGGALLGGGSGAKFLFFWLYDIVLTGLAAMLTAYFSPGVEGSGIPVSQMTMLCSLLSVIPGTVDNCSKAGSLSNGEVACLSTNGAAPLEASQRHVMISKPIAFGKPKFICRENPDSEFVSTPPGVGLTRRGKEPKAPHGT